ncbi:MAG: hypothetical protein KAS04_03885 [Candidatus Aenigmarchaeota archaeon]|nr:hypothetical protein [Candidatus Aenigmarchaeota archaeon]
MNYFYIFLLFSAMLIFVIIIGILDWYLVGIPYIKEIKKHEISTLRGARYYTQQSIIEIGVFAIGVYVGYKVF